MFRCPECGNDLLSIRVLNEEQRRLVRMFQKDALKCEVCDIFYEVDALKTMIYHA